MEPKRIERKEHSVSRDNFSAPARKVLERLNSHGYLGYLAGGAVRDILLNREPKDFDVATDARPNQIRKVFRNSRMIGRRFRLAHIYFHDEIIECSTFRRQVDPRKEKPYHGKAFKEKEGMVVRDNVYGTPEEDALRRDFTVNALFYDISDFSVIDYVDGMRDLDARIIRCIGDPPVRYTEDPVRMIRALRFASKLNFTIEEATYEGIKEKRKMMLHAAPARIYEEIQKLFFCGNAVKLFDYLENTGLLEVVFPEFSRFIEDNANEHDWTVRIMRQFDKWTNAGAHIAPPVLFALMFGPYYESLAAKIGGGDIRQKMRDVAAMHLGGMRERIVVPKTVKESVGYIMADQSKLTGSRKNRRKLPRQRGFGEAFLYFKLRSRHTGEHGEDVEYWEQCLQK